MLNSTIYCQHTEILKEKCHYVMILRPSILFMNSDNFRLQYYAAMNLCGGFQNPDKAEEIFKNQTKFLYLKEEVKEAENSGYIDDYTTNDPFNSISGYWRDINNT